MLCNGIVDEDCGATHTRKTLAFNWTRFGCSWWRVGVGSGFGSSKTIGGMGFEEVKFGSQVGHVRQNYEKERARISS